MNRHHLTSLTRLALISLVALGALAPAAHAKEQVITIFEGVELQHELELPDGTVRGEVALHHEGRGAQRTLELPVLLPPAREARRIIAAVHVEPVMTKMDGRRRPGDPWTRMGSLSLITNEGIEREAAQRRQAERDPNAEIELDKHAEEIELMRFITGFGGEVTFTQDVTSLAPLLTGNAHLRVFIDTWLNPAWRVTVTLTYSDENLGARWPGYAETIFNDQAVHAEANVLRGVIDVPEDMGTLRLRVLSTGHATDGAGGDEFVTRDHILKIDGRTVAQFRPWRENGGGLREWNPRSGRAVIAGREVWASDFDRSGWHPGAVVEPIIIAVPELAPGRHTIELRIRDIRPLGADDERGFWRTSAIAVADRRWPIEQLERD